MHDAFRAQSDFIERVDCGKVISVKAKHVGLLKDITGSDVPTLRIGRKVPFAGNSFLRGTSGSA